MCVNKALPDWGKMICSYCIDEISIYDCAVYKDGKWFHAKRQSLEDQNELSTCWAHSEHGTKRLYPIEGPHLGDLASHAGMI